MDFQYRQAFQWALHCILIAGSYQRDLEVRTNSNEFCRSPFWVDWFSRLPAYGPYWSRPACGESSFHFPTQNFALTARTGVPPRCSLTWQRYDGFTAPPRWVRPAFCVVHAARLRSLCGYLPTIFSEGPSLLAIRWAYTQIPVWAYCSSPQCSYWFHWLPWGSIWIWLQLLRRPAVPPEAYSEGPPTPTDTAWSPSSAVYAIPPKTAFPARDTQLTIWAAGPTSPAAARAICENLCSTAQHPSTFRAPSRNCWSYPGKLLPATELALSIEPGLQRPFHSMIADRQWGYEALWLLNLTMSFTGEVYEAIAFLYGWSPQ